MPVFCKFIGCDKRTSFGIPGGKPTHCGKHKTEQMEDLVNKRCEHEGCKSQPAFGIPGGKPTHCSKHKTEQMEDLVNKRCEYEGCKSLSPVFGIPGGKPTHCGKHKTEQMENIKNKRCLSEWCTYLIRDDKYDGYCTHCFRYLFPNDPRTPKIRSKTKEELVRDVINDKFDGFVHDKPISWGCCNTRRRIDHRKLINGTMLAIETDEYQHRGYDQQDEANRYDDLFVGAYSGNWVFIRFNPDGYIDSKGKQRKSMFDKNGKQVSAEVKRRMKVLIEEMEIQIKRIEKGKNIDLVTVVKLFFDGYHI